MTSIRDGVLGPSSFEGHDVSSSRMEERENEDDEQQVTAVDEAT